MTYQTAYKLLVAAYKSAKGIMPEGLDLLKIKQKARQKVIDAKKVIQFPKERITDWTKARPQGLARYEGGGEGIKKLIDKGLIKIGEVTKRKKVKEPVDSKLIQEERIKEIMKQNKASAKRLQEKMNKPEKSLGEKLKDYDGDPDAMADGGKVKKPFRSKVVDFLGGPSVVGAELGLSGLLEVYNLLGMPLMKDGGKVKRRKKGEAMDDDGEEPGPKMFPRIPEGEIFLDKMPRPKRSDGIISLAVGGMTNIGDTYDNNPTLQSQYPNKQDYLDLFSSQTTTTTPEVAAIPETTTSTIAPINPIKPIIPLPQDSGDGGGGILNNFGRTNMNQPNAMGGKTPGFKAGVQRAINDFKTLGGGLIDIAKVVNPLDPEKFNIMNLYKMGKEAFSKRGDRIAKEQIAKAIALEEEMARRQEDIIRSRSPSGSMDYGPSGYEGMSDAASDQERSEGGRGSRG